MEWPSRIQLGNSDIVRVSLLPTAEGYTVKAEFPEHPTQSKEVSVPRPAGYDLFAIAQLEGAAFDIAPQGEQRYRLDQNEEVTWRWSLTPLKVGTHRLALTLRLRWEPRPDANLPLRESMIFSRGLQVEVSSILGMTGSQAGIAGATLGLVLLLVIVGYLGVHRSSQQKLDILTPNPGVILEPLPGSLLPAETQDLLRALFSRYARVLVTAEFQSGYSGSRTWLVLPVHQDNRRDAQTIVKIGPADLILAEFKNYETSVKDTLPPVTARIQQPPAGLPKNRRNNRSINQQPAALRYTFIGQAGHAQDGEDDLAPQAARLYGGLPPAARTDAEHFTTERARETRETQDVPETEAAVLADRGQLDEALKSCNQALQIDPKCARAFAERHHGHRQAFDRIFAVYREVLAGSADDAAREGVPENVPLQRDFETEQQVLQRIGHQYPHGPCGSGTCSSVPMK